MFEDVTCGNDNTSNEISTDLFVKKIYDICPNATELHNATNFEDGMYITYCGKSLLSSLLFKIMISAIKYTFVNFDIELKRIGNITVLFRLYG